MPISLFTEYSVQRKCVFWKLRCVSYSKNAGKYIIQSFYLFIEELPVLKICLCCVQFWLPVLCCPNVGLKVLLFAFAHQVCREYQRGNCKRAESECRFAHPPEHVTVDSAEGMVTVCMDFVKGRCSRDLCRYFHPTPHLQAQLKAAQSRANAAATQAAMVGKNTLLASLPLYLFLSIFHPPLLYR